MYSILEVAPYVFVSSVLVSVLALITITKAGRFVGYYVWPATIAWWVAILTGIFSIAQVFIWLTHILVG